MGYYGFYLNTSIPNNLVLLHVEQSWNKFWN